MSRKTMSEIYEELQRENTNAGNAAPGWNRRVMRDLVLTQTQGFVVITLQDANARAVPASYAPIGNWDQVFYRSEDLFEADLVAGTITAKAPMTAVVDFDIDTDTPNNTKMLLRVNFPDMPYDAYKTRIDGKGGDDTASMSGKKFNLDPGESVAIDWQATPAGNIDIVSATFTVGYIPRVYPPGPL